MAGDARRGRSLQRAWTAQADTEAWSYYIVGLQAAVADPVTARRMLDDYAAAFGETILATQAEADQTAQMLREWYVGIDRADTLASEDKGDGIPA